LIHHLLILHPLILHPRDWRYAVSIPYRTLPYRLVPRRDGIGKKEVGRDGTVRYAVLVSYTALPCHRKKDNLLTMTSDDMDLISFFALDVNRNPTKITRINYLSIFSWKWIVMEENISKPDLYVSETSSPISDQFISTLGSVGEQPSLPLIHLPSFYSIINWKAYPWQNSASIKA
jgi:hypothetical protein